METSGHLVFSDLTIQVLDDSFVGKIRGAIITTGEVFETESRGEGRGRGRQIFEICSRKRWLGKVRFHRFRRRTRVTRRARSFPRLAGNRLMASHTAGSLRFFFMASHAAKRGRGLVVGAFQRYVPAFARGCEGVAILTGPHRFVVA